MDIRSLNTFIHVAEMGSFSRAAERLGYSQPTVSVHIRQLEETLGGKLFDRIGHAVQLTEKGRDMLRYAQSICQLSSEMTRRGDAPAEPSGTIRLGLADSLCAPMIAGQFISFRKRFPKISLDIITGGTKELFRLLDQNEVDMVCTLDNHIYDSSYIIAGEEQIGVHFVVSPSHVLSKAKLVTLQELTEHPLLLTEKGMSYRRQLDERMAQESLQVHPVLEMGSADLLCHLTQLNMGISFLPDYVTQTGVQQGQLVRLCIKDFEPQIWKQLLYRRDKWVSAPMQAVIDFFSRITL